MFSFEIDCDPEQRDLLVADLWEQGSAGIVEIDDRHLRAFFDEFADRAELARRYQGARLREEEERDWVQSARDLLQPMEVGRRFFLVPEWRDDPAPPGRFRVTINPGMAFGTGVHASTQLCIEAMEDYLRTGSTFVDIGAGSGILSQAAELLGAGKVYACDIDPVAVAIARRGFVGSVNALASGVADLLVANISPEAIISLASDLLRVLKPGGVLLAGGLESADVSAAQAALPPAREIRRKGNWALLVI
ncbi:MAG TPA: 50S ribosomal protein L11 methyltransferase [Bryobacteraceae bacterium]|nr:50S ribosomal protein L11 methyltransferase [Bryobacteraceae bacterium]